MKRILPLIILLLTFSNVFSQTTRERINFDENWLFAYGHPYDFEKDFSTGTSYFTYLAKAGYGDGAASLEFDDRAWRPLRLPHDWAVEVPFDKDGSHSHGYKAVGRNFPEASVGWYRKHFTIDEKDFGKQIFIDFDGVSRDAQVWVNGHYLGNEPSGYQSFGYNITEVLNYGGNNVVAVRADVTIEEGWYYEGAGIYRHVWLSKTSDIHVPKYGTFVFSEINKQGAKLTVQTEVANRGKEKETFTITQRLLNAEGEQVKSIQTEQKSLQAMSKGDYEQIMELENPKLWSLEEPYLYTVITEIKVDGKLVDEYKTRTGIRSISFDAKKGFFLNGRHVKLKGTNNHQDHAGVGCAMPDELLRWRLQQLKNFGSNAIRSSHNPATPELLDLCDEMGFLVVDENRLMGTTQEAFNEVERLIKRDRNHPSIFVWSMGNEEWAIECNEFGARITESMQAFARTIDPTRPMNVAVSGGCNVGTSTVAEIMGYNYLGQWDTDKHHELFPNQPSMGTEEGSTYATRGIYFDDPEKHYIRAYDHKPRSSWKTIENTWKHYAEREYLAGMFIWTGFDYRGEPTPHKWPSITSYFGMMDLCGFPKDNVYYLKSWWQNEPVLHILPHWNWEGKEGEEIDVWVYSNAEEVELFLNGKTQGKQKMPVNGHLEWKVPYKKGELKAISYAKGKKVQEEVRNTTGKAQKLNMHTNKSELKGSQDIAVIRVDVLDKKQQHIPTANNKVYFEIEGPAEIVGLGNGDPTSLEKDVFIDDYKQIPLPEIQIAEDNKVELMLNALPLKEQESIQANNNLKLCYSQFELNKAPQANQEYTWYYTHVGKQQKVYVNGELIDENITDSKKVALRIDNSILREGNNNILIVTEPYQPKTEWDIPNKKIGAIQVYSRAEKIYRSLFNGLAQVIVKATGEAGVITLKAYSENVEECKIKIEAKQ